MASMLFNLLFLLVTSIWNVYRIFLLIEVLPYC